MKEIIGKEKKRTSLDDFESGYDIKDMELVLWGPTVMKWSSTYRRLLRESLHP